MKLLGKAISGTCGARTYSVGGAGVTARQKTCPVNKNSLAQARRRGLFAAAASAFKALTAQQREELHARALAAAETDVFGKKIVLSDYALFLREYLGGDRPKGPSLLTEDETWNLIVTHATNQWVYLISKVWFLFDYDPLFNLVPAGVYDVATKISSTEITNWAGTSKGWGFAPIEVGGTLYHGFITNQVAPSDAYRFGSMSRKVNVADPHIEFNRIFV